MNVEIGTEAAQFPFWEFFSPIFGTAFLQCIREDLLSPIALYITALWDAYMDSAYSNFAIGFRGAVRRCWSWGTGP